MFSLLLPTLGTRENELRRLFDSLLDQEKVDIEVIIIAQGGYDLLNKVVKEYKDKLKLKIVHTSKKGLSHARNTGLKYVTGDILVLTDDDCWYPKNIFKKINNIIENSQICTFQIYDPNKKEYFKEYSNESRIHRSFFQSFKVASIEIFVNLKKVKITDIVFDENFGLGSKYPSGEENTLLIDLIKKGYTISYFPIVAVYHNKPKFSFDEYNLEAKGAFFSRNFSKPLALLLGICFFFKKINLIKNNKIRGLISIVKGSLLL